MMTRLLLALTLLTTSLSVTAQDERLVPIEASVANAFEQLQGDTRVADALQWIHEHEDQTIAEQIRLTEIPAPPFMEEVRAQYYLEQMRARGLTQSWMDREGNVLGLRPGSGDGPVFVISAHLDTVFPIETDVEVQERDGRYYAPGIIDDSRGLSALLTVIDALQRSQIETVGDILFVGTVGEEGRGDLRGVKALFEDHPHIDGFVSIDGAGLNRITNGATGSRRFEVHFSGPGGHSFSAFGTASATHAMGRAIARIADTEVPEEPRTTFTVGTVEGGTSVNAIAGDAMFALDMRSNDPEALVELEERIKALVDEAVTEENERWERGEIQAEFRLIGDRPAGLTAPEETLVQASVLGFEAVGAELENLGRSSTDSNLPMSLGVPAITIGGGGTGGGAHSLDEWFEPVESHRGPQLALLITLAMVGVEGVTPALLPRR